MDSAVIPLSRHNMFLVQTVDFFYPLIDDPYIMGKIALANVVSDVYATGVTKIDKLRMIISAPTEFTEEQRDVIIPLMIKGFKDSASNCNVKVDVGSVSINPWCIVGGIATSVCLEDEIIFPNQVIDGDVLVLTKPLGTQLATNSYIWKQEISSEWIKLQENGITIEDCDLMYHQAINSMSFLNKIAAELMHKYSAHGATDVTGFGLLGHAENLANFQQNNVSFELDTLPIIKNVMRISKILGREVKLLAGKAVETSGGLLIAMPHDKAHDFCNDFMEQSKMKAWIIGKVVAGKKDASMAKEVKIIEV